MEATSEGEMVDEDRLSELVSKELDRLVNDRFDKFDESLKDFGKNQFVPPGPDGYKKRG